MMDNEQLIRNEHFKGYSDAAWCRFALRNTHWPIWKLIEVTLDTPQSFNDARNIVENMLRDGWSYRGVEGDGEVLLRFSKEFPVIDEERAQAEIWLKGHDRV